MNEEEFKSQVLKNQITMMSSIQVSSDISRIALENRVEETKQLLNPTNNKSAVEKEQERTKEFFEEEFRSKFGTRKK